jgi:hypothetical protein
MPKNTAKIRVTDGMVSPSRHLDVTPSLSGFIDIALSTTTNSQSDERSIHERS